jgi:hypothetical protein
MKFNYATSNNLPTTQNNNGNRGNVDEDLIWI